MDIRLTRYIILLALLPLLLLAMAGCGGNGAARRSLDRADSLMNSKPEVAMAILDSVNAESLHGKKEKARYALLKSIALDKNYVDTTDFSVLQPAIDYYLKHGTADEKLKTYYYQGRIYQNRNDNDSAMLCFMNGRELCREATDTLVIANLMVAQAILQYLLYNFEDFTRNNLDAARLYKAIGRTDYEFLNLINALDGSVTQEDKHLSDSIFTLCKHMVKQHPEFSHELEPYYITYATQFSNKEDILKVLESYEDKDTLDNELKLDMANAYRKIGDASNAERYLESIGRDTKTGKSFKYICSVPAILEMNGDYAGALAAYKVYSLAVDSMHQLTYSRALLFSEKQHETEKNNLLVIQGRNHIILVCLCVAFLLLIVAVFLFYRYRLGKAKIQLDEKEKEQLHLERQNLKKENENLELERKNAMLECERKSLMVENLQLKVNRLEEESAALKEILEEQKDLAKPISDAIRVRVEMLNGLLATQISENDSYSKPYNEWTEQLLSDKEEFMDTTRLAFKASHPRFIQYLEDHGLTEAEINYVCLYAIGLRGKEVGEYMKVRRHYHRSSDIRKKLGIDEHQTNIGIYIRKLMKQL